METSSDHFSIFAPRSAAVRQENNVILALPETFQACSSCEEHVVANVCSALLPSQSKHLFSVVLTCLPGWSLPNRSKLRRQQAAVYSSFTPYFSSASSVTSPDNLLLRISLYSEFCSHPHCLFLLTKVMASLNFKCSSISIWNLPQTLFSPQTFPLLWKIQFRYVGHLLQPNLTWWKLFYCYE